MLEPGEAEFSRVLEDWRATCGTARTSVSDWERDIRTLVDEERSLRTDGAWLHGRDDLFGVLGINRAEIRHSAMIAWLLDPSARHGLGTRFLDSFLERAFNRAFEDTDRARTTCEVAREECRADIVVDTPTWNIIIENKVDANESPRQCDILYERFAREGIARFVFLTPSGRKPESASGEAAAAFASLGYRDVRDLLARALCSTPAAQSSRGRHIAEDYLRTLEREFR